jgi:hypothetical protein
MLIPHKQIIGCLEAAHESAQLIQLHTRQNGDFDTSIDDFRKFMLTYAEVAVWNHPLPHDGEPIRGATIIYDNQYDIVLLAGQDPNWKRFVEFKEHFHVILDKSDKDCVFRNNDYVSQVENTFAAFPDVKNKSAPPVACEKLAEIAAMEFLMPYNRRSTMKENIANGSTTLETYAGLYKIPEDMIDLYLSPSYMDALNPEIGLGKANQQ